MRSPYLLLSIAFAGGCACGGGTPPPKSSVGRIVFVSTRDESWEIYSMKSDGSDVQRLTENINIDLCPTVSPDGSQIAFCSTRDGQSDTEMAQQIFELYLMNSDGTKQERLTVHGGLSREPRFSPDGKELVCTMVPDSGKDTFSEIYTLSIDSKSEKRLTRRKGRDEHPIFNRTGSKIIWLSEADGDFEIMTMNSDGTDVRQLTKNKDTEIDVAVHPTTDEIYFLSRKEGKWDIYKISEGGGEPVRITSDGKKKTHLKFLDSETILYSGIDGSHSRIIAISIDGTNRRVLTSGDGDDQAPTAIAPPAK